MPDEKTCSVIENDRICGEPATVLVPGCGCGDPECAGDICLCEQHGRTIGFVQE